ncbi:nSTAND3 domain-containing NTPase [Inquilinus sp. OTU3971]|uniref:nSTAND3 domain-containing NTPase n=1 Tax=Inquilinus sp. OTU3971 TaxID=3043855 RepID=UPI00313B5833
MTAPALRSATAGAKAALDGYEYQLGVSVFAALRLMLITKSATRITLEPANEEDLESDLEPATPGRIQPSANMADGYKLVVQVKLRNSGPWTITDFDALLRCGTTRRPAKHHLDDPGTRYLLITNADATGKARDLLVHGLEEWPEDRPFPASLSGTLAHKPEGRVAIWGVLTERLLDLEINDILGSLMRVPHSRQAECRARLRDEARRRMGGTSRGVWTREELLSVIRGCGGYLASAPQLEAFVPPANYQALSDLLERRNALVITGPSGTGKTWTALALVDQARQRPSAPEIIQVKVNNGPSSTRTLTDTGPKLFYVEDPWGQYSLRGGADAWTEQLPRLLREAHAGHQYVITSRSDMLGLAKADERLTRWTVVVDADQYRDGQLADIYDKRLELLATDLQAKALDFRTDALEALETPFEINLFFTYMADGPEPDEVDPAFYQRILALAHREAVEDVVVSYLNASDQTGWSAIIWALLAARSQFDRSQLISLSRQLRITGPASFDGLEKLVNRLVATRHLRQPGQTVSFSHPSVRAGFEIFIKENWARSEATLASLISALTQLGGSQRDWALETAARSFQAISDLVAGAENLDSEFEAESASRATIDAWLEEGLIDSKADFRSLLQLASDVGTRTSTPSELARWFIQGIRRGGQFFLDDWQPPSFDDAWYRRISADPRSLVIADRFVREQLPEDRDGYGDNFSTELDRIATGLTPAFLAAARKVVTSGFDRNVGAVATGAVRDLDRYEEVLEAALDELADLRRSYEREGKEQWRAIQDGECDAADEEGYQFQHEGDDYAARVLVAAYVKRVRSLGRWETLAEHRRIVEFGRVWADDVMRANGSVSLEELRTLIAITGSSSDEDGAWDAAREHWKASLFSDLVQRILSNPGDKDLRGALAFCALMKAPAALPLCFERLAATPALFVHLLVDVHAAQRRISSKTRARRVRPLLKLLPSVALEIFAALSVEGKPLSAVDQETLVLLERAAETAAPFVLDVIVPIMIASGAAPSAAIRRWLVETTDNRLAKAAADAAIRIQDDALVWLALGHARADAREAAITYLAARLPDPLPPRLLNLSSDPGCRVRRTLVRIVARRPRVEHQSVLLKLIDDVWSDAEAFHNEPPSYPIAREAVVALATYGGLSDEIGEALLVRAERTDDRSLGIVALNTAAQCCSPAIRKKVWDLSFIDQPRWVRVDAIDALSRSDVVESEIVEAITPKLLHRLPPPLAASACVLLATHGRVEAVVEAMERIACSAKRRALLLLGVHGLADRDRPAALGLLTLLGPNHPGRRLLDLADGECLPKTVLDDLGHIRFRKAVQSWLDDKIAKN